VNDLDLIATIDRSEHVDVEYELVSGRLAQRQVTMTDVPSWDPSGTGPHSVAAMTEFCRDVITAGGELAGAFSGHQCLGLSVVHPSFEPGLGWLAFLHVSRQFRRRGAASALWDAAARTAAGAGSRRLYVSATPTGSAVGFYLSRGCQLADPVHPDLYAREPDDIHLICSLS
jgi:ribosomal protein S18 acetylase RimI-like enzyme